MRQKFNNPEGRVVFVEVTEVSQHYPAGTWKVEVSIYPVGSGSYSSFIYTQESFSKIESNLAVIAQEILNKEQNSWSSSQISQVITHFLTPLFPQPS